MNWNDDMCSIYFPSYLFEKGSSGFSVGDRVMGCTRFGGYATMICVGTEYLRKIPQGWDYDQGAAFLAQVCIYMHILKRV